METKDLLWQLSFLKGLPLGQCVGQTLLWWNYQFRYSLVTSWEPSRKCQHSNYVLPSNQQQGQENVKICHDGQNRPHFFRKFAMKKTALVIRLPASVGQLLRDRTVVTKLSNLLQIYLHQAYFKQNKYRVSLLWWMSSRRSLDIKVKNTWVLFNSMFDA